MNREFGLGNWSYVTRDVKTGIWTVSLELPLEVRQLKDDIE